MARFVARLISLFGAIITSLVTNLRSRARAVIKSPGSPWSTSSTPMGVPRNPDRIAEDAPVSEFSSLLIAVSRTTARANRIAVSDRTAATAAPFSYAHRSTLGRAESGKVTQGRSRLDLLAERATAPRAAPQARDAAQLRQHSRPREDLRSPPGTLTCWGHRHRLSTSDRRHRLLTSSDRRPRAITIVAQIQRSQTDRPAPQAPDTISASVCRCLSRLEHLRRELGRRVAQEPPYPGAFASSAGTKAATSAAAFVRRAGGHADR